MNNQPYQPDPRVPEYPGSNDPTIPDAQMYRTANRSATAQSDQNYGNPRNNQGDRRPEIPEDTNAERSNIRYWITHVIYYILGVLEVIMLLRFLFRLLDANPSNSFVSFLYSLSYVFVAPFEGIFTDPHVGRVVLEITTLIAMLIYALVAWGLVWLGRIIFAPTYSSR